MNKKNYLGIFLLVLVVGVVVALNTDIKDKIFKDSGDGEENIVVSNDDENVILEVTMQNSYKTGDIEELYKDSSVVLIAEFLSNGKTEIKNNGIPNTYISFKIKKVLKNDSGIELGDKIDAKRTGGTVTVQELIAARGPEYAKKMGIDNMSKVAVQNKLVKFVNSDNLGDKSLTEWKTRLLMLTYDKEDNSFVIMQDEYGMLSYDETTNKAFGIKEGKNVEYSFLEK